MSSTLLSGVLIFALSKDVVLAEASVKAALETLSAHCVALHQKRDRRRDRRDKGVFLIVCDTSR